MNPISFFRATPAEESEEEHDANSLCYSSLSDNSETSEDETKRKVMEKQYSRLAFSISRMGKDDQDGEIELNVSSDGPQNTTPVEIDTTTMTGTEQNEEKKQKVIDR